MARVIASVSSCGSLRKHLERVVFEQFEKFPVGDQSGFDDLGHPGTETPRSGSVRSIERVAQHEIGLIEGSYHILVSFEIHPRSWPPTLASDLCQQCGCDEAEAQSRA